MRATRSGNHALFLCAALLSLGCAALVHAAPFNIRAHYNKAEYRIPMRDGHATGEYEDFLTGFVTQDGKVWGRPVGVTVGQDGSLFVSDDGTKTVWHVIYTGK